MKPRVGTFFDGGTKTGVAVMTYEQKPKLLFVDTIRLERFASYGLRLHHLDGEIQRIINKWKPWHVGFEAPFSGGNAFGSRLPICCAGKIEEVADRNRITCSEVAPSTIKLVVAESGRADKRAVRAGVFNLGYKFVGEHEADAIGTGLVCINNWLLGR